MGPKACILAVTAVPHPFGIAIKLFGLCTSVVVIAGLYFASRDPVKLQQQCAASNGAISVTLDGHTMKLQQGKHFFMSAGQLAAAMSAQDVNGTN